MLAYESALALDMKSMMILENQGRRSVDGYVPECHGLRVPEQQ